MNKTFYVKYIGIIDGDMGILTRKVTANTRYPKFHPVYINQPKPGTFITKVNNEVHSQENLITHYKEVKESTITKNASKELVFKLKKREEQLSTSLIKPEKKAPKQLTKILSENLSMEKHTGIPNPDKYYSKAINDIMPVQKLRVARNNNHKSLFNIQCPVLCSGVKDMKLTRSREKLFNISCKRASSHSNGWKVSHRFFNGRRKDCTLFGNALSIKNASCSPNRKVRTKAAAHRSKKRRIVLHLHRETKADP